AGGLRFVLRRKHAGPWRGQARRVDHFFWSPWASGLRAARWSRRGGACHAGEARARAASASRIAARPQSWAVGQADAMAILMRRTLMRTSAPILSSLRRMGPQLACAT